MGGRPAALSLVSVPPTPIIFTDPCRSRKLWTMLKSPRTMSSIPAMLSYGHFRKLITLTIPAVLVANHGPFCWGGDAGEAAHNAAILEAVARMAYFTVRINERAEPVGRSLHDKHYLRKHGTNAYYGQKKEEK